MKYVLSFISTNELWLKKCVHYYENDIVTVYFRWKEFREKERTKDEDHSQGKIDAMFARKYGSDHPKQKALVKSVALNLIVDCDLPFHVVDRPGFMRHHKAIDKSYDKIDRYECELVILKFTSTK